MFLVGVNINLDEVKCKIPSQKPIPSVREECRKRVIFGDTETSSKPETENLVLVSRGPGLEGEMRRNPWCDHCKKSWHTRETCWKMHRKPHFKKRHVGRALQTVAESSQAQQINSTAAPFTKEQLEHLQKLF